MANVARRLRPLGTFRIYTRQSTIYVEPQSGVTDMDAVYHACSQIFGIVSVVRAVPCEKSVPAIVETAKLYLAPEFARAKDFKVESKRADKRFPLNSIQLSQQVGSLLHRAFPKVAVNVHDPELTVYVEIRERAAYVHGPTLPGAGGLPVGMGGKAVSLLSGGIDSPVASWMMARRGVWLEMVHFESPPYTSPQAQEKVLRLAQELAPWCGQLLVHIVPFTEIQEEIRRSCPEEYFTLIMRRFMMRLAQAVSRAARLSSPASLSARWRARPWRLSPSRRTPWICPFSGPSSASTRWRSSTPPAASAPTRPPSCPLRTAAPSSPPGIPTPGPGSPMSSPPRAPWMWTPSWKRPSPASSGSGSRTTAPSSA